MWIYERYDWMNFTWDREPISALAERVSSRIGYLHGRPVRERISNLDHEQCAAGSVTLADMVHKYMAYLSAEAV